MRHQQRIDSQLPIASSILESCPIPALIAFEQAVLWKNRAFVELWSIDDSPTVQLHSLNLCLHEHDLESVLLAMQTLHADMAQKITRITNIWIHLPGEVHIVMDLQLERLSEGQTVIYFMKSSALLSGPSTSRKHHLSRAEETTHAVQNISEDYCDAAGMNQQDRELLNITINALPMHVAVLDHDFNIVHVNESWTRFATENGGKYETVCPGVNYLETCHKVKGRDRKVAHRAINGLLKLRDKRIDQLEFDYRCDAPKKKRWFRMQARLITTSKGAELIVVSHEDISRMRIAEEHVRESEERYRKLADQSPSMMWSGSTAIQRQFFNKTWLEFRGKRLSEDVGNRWLSRVHPEDQEACYRTCKEASDDGKPFRHEYRMRDAAGCYCWVLEVGVPRKDTSGRLIGFCGTCLNINARKQAETARKEMVSMVSHELRTPLSSILGFTELLLHRNVSPDTGREYLEIINTETKRLSNLINDFLDIQRMESGRMRFNFQPVNLTDIVKSILELFKPQLVDRVVNFRFNRFEDMDVCADKERLKQVFTNLLSNAVKYSPHGTPIEIRAVRSERDVHFRVIDHGKGIPKEDHENVFRNFFRVDREEDENITGTGLGLPLVRKILKRHGGEIWISDTPGGGTTMNLSIPISPTENVLQQNGKESAIAN